MLTRTGDGNALIRAVVVIDPKTGVEHAAPPLDEISLEWARDLPEIPTARTFTVEQRLTESPFGTLTMHYRLHRGRVIEAGLGSLGASDIIIGRRYDRAVNERAGHLDLMESVEGGHIQGDLSLLTLFLGIYDSDECRDSRRRLEISCREQLSELGLILSSSSWREYASTLVEGESSPFTDR